MQQGLGNRSRSRVHACKAPLQNIQRIDALKRAATHECAEVRGQQLLLRLVCGALEQRGKAVEALQKASRQTGTASKGQ